MSAVVGPVVVREGGYAFDVWTPEGGLSRSFCYDRVEHAHYARRVEIGSRVAARKPMACDTVEEFDAALADLAAPHKQLAIAA